MIAHNHGPLENIKQNYTQSHINNFLREIDAVERLRFKESIIATRVGGATEKGYKEYMGHLRQRERSIQRTQTKGQQMKTYEEEIWMEAREHVKLAQLPPEKRTQFEAERDSMWGQIPQHLQDKARKLAGR